jgi:hypothetical protein
VPWRCRGDRRGCGRRGRGMRGSPGSARRRPRLLVACRRWRRL